MKVLTKKQCSDLSCLFNRNKLDKNREVKTNIVNSKLKSFGIDLVITPDLLEDFFDRQLPRLEKEMRVERFRLAQEGKIQTPYTPSDKIKVPYQVVEKPVLGMWYHLSWAFKGAKFKLMAITIDGKGTVWTGKTNDKRLDIKLADLRHLR